MTEQARQAVELAEPTQPTPKNYVACLAAYNAGHLRACWIEAAQEVDAIRSEIEAMFKASSIPFSEEYAIHDYEGFGGAKIPEHCSIAKVACLAAFIVKHGKLGAELLKYFDRDFDEAEAAFEEYAGRHQSHKNLSHFAAELSGVTAQVPINPTHYIDHDAVGRDMELNGDLFTIDTGFEQLHVFWAR